MVLSNQFEMLHSLAAIQDELRKLPTAGSDSATLPSSAGPGGIRGMLTMVRPAKLTQVFGCRLLHWRPELEDFRVGMTVNGKPRSLKVYDSHLDARVGGRPHVFFDKLYKTTYGALGEPGPPVERRFGITYLGLQSKREVKPDLDALKDCATRAGALVASAREQLASCLPAATLAAKLDLYRWIFTVYDLAWGQPKDSPRYVTQYIPVDGLNESMRTNESILYDLNQIRATSWGDVERRLDKNRWGTYAHLKDPYASWGVELPVYYASRIDDFVQASDWAIDWLTNQLKNCCRL